MTKTDQKLTNIIAWGLGELAENLGSIGDAAGVVQGIVKRHCPDPYREADDEMIRIVEKSIMSSIRETQETQGSGNERSGKNNPG